MPKSFRPLPEEARTIMARELSVHIVEEHQFASKHTAAYEVNLGPFNLAYYSTRTSAMEDAPQNHLIWETEGQELYGRQPQEVVEIVNRIAEAQEIMQNLGYPCDFWQARNRSEYAATFEKPAEVDTLVEELAQVRDKFRNWKW